MPRARPEEPVAQAGTGPSRGNRANSAFHGARSKQTYVHERDMIDVLCRRLAEASGEGDQTRVEFRRAEPDRAMGIQ